MGVYAHHPGKVGQPHPRPLCKAQFHKREEKRVTEASPGYPNYFQLQNAASSPSQKNQVSARFLQLEQNYLRAVLRLRR